MAQEIIEQTTEDIGKFMGEFGVAYTKELLNSKIQDAISDVVKTVKPKEEGPPSNEEKKLEDKVNDLKPLAAGVVLLSYKNGWGPDHVEHRYYDFAGWSIKSKDSVVTNITYRHRQLADFQNHLKKRVPKAGNLPFPQKKMFGKKDSNFYCTRFGAMQKYFDEVSKEPEVALDEGLLKFFKLQFDPVAALRLQTFTSALQDICANDSIDWEYAFGCAQRLGLESSEVDLLKIVAVEKLGRDAAWRVYDKVWEVTPGFIPYSVKAKMAYSAENKLYSMIGTTVEASWKGVEEGFNKVADSLSDVMDKAVDPLKEMLIKVLEPCKEFVESKLGKKEEEKKPEKEDKKDDIDEMLLKVKAERFTPLKEALADLAKGASAAETCRKTMNQICLLDFTWQYVPYIQYPSGDSILEWFPPIENIIEKHNRLTVAVIDVVYVLGRGLCRALEPLCEYVDKAAENFDEKTHEEEVKKAVWTGGKRLAVDYFSLPYTTWRACWWCGDDVTQQVLTFCKETVNLGADLLGSAASNWKPTSKADVREKFAEAVRSALDEFISDRTFVLVSMIRDASIQLVADLFNEMFGDSITKIGEVLTDLVSKLPPPLNQLQPADIVASIFQALVTAASTAAVKRWAGKTERFIADPEAGEPTPWTKELAAKFRVSPRIRNDNDDNTKAEESEEDKKKNQKPKKDGADATTADTATTDAGTTETNTEG